MIYNTCVIKNLNTTDETVLGVVLAQNETYTIPDTKRLKASNDSSILERISNSILQIGDGTNFFNETSTQINYLNSYKFEIDDDGRQVTRLATTIKGWHYQSHSVQFEVNKLSSIYNKDHNGQDLGFAEIKIYKDDGQGGLAECTTQLDADANGIKSVITWKPDYNFEIISGNIRQKTKETINTYLYVLADVDTGYPAPNDRLEIPFTTGGINLSYIGADETLKTDGRSSKYFKGSEGDYFKIICNYPENILTNDNRHSMSIIFEIYKDPAS